MVALIMVGDLRKRLSLIDVFRELFEVVLTFGVLANVFPVLRGKGLVALGRHHRLTVPPPVQRPWRAGGLQGRL